VLLCPERCVTSQRHVTSQHHVTSQRRSRQLNPDGLVFAVTLPKQSIFKFVTETF